MHEDQVRDSAYHEAVGERHPGQLQTPWRRWLRDGVFVGSALVSLVVIVVAIFAPALAPHSPTVQHLGQVLMPPAWTAKGQWRYPLGTDYLGRDILSRLIYGDRTAMYIVVLAVASTTIGGSLVGLMAGLANGIVGDVLMRITDLFIALPGLIITMAIVLLLGANATNVTIAIATQFWMTHARVVRQVTRSLSQQEFVTAARSVGATSAHIAVKHALRNVAPTILTLSVLEVAQVILVESSISFLGFGIQPPQVSWGLMLANTRDYLYVNPWLVAWPGLAILTSALAFNLLGLRIGSLLDPLQRVTYGRRAILGVAGTK